MSKVIWHLSSAQDNSVSSCNCSNAMVSDPNVKSLCGPSEKFVSSAGVKFASYLFVAISSVTLLESKLETEDPWLRAVLEGFVTGPTSR